MDSCLKPVSSGNGEGGESTTGNLTEGIEIHRAGYNDQWWPGLTHQHENPISTDVRGKKNVCNDF